MRVGRHSFAAYQNNLQHDETVIRPAADFAPAFRWRTRPNPPHRFDQSAVFAGSSLFMLANLNTGNPNRPDFVQLNVGYRLIPTDVVSVEVNTWQYAWPLGIPFGKSFLAPEEKYLGNLPESFARLEPSGTTIFSLSRACILGLNSKDISGTLRP